MGIVLRAAARSISVTAACRDMSGAPSDQAILNAVSDGLPKTFPVLEGRINDCLTEKLPPHMLRRSWPVAIDWHLQPYYGKPHKKRNEIYKSKPKQGTSKFHAYPYTMKSRQGEVTFRICVNYRTYQDKKGKRRRKKLLFAAWRVHGGPTEIRELYRKRFGIETSYRQMRQARIYTCTRDPHLRLFFLAVGLILRNVWVWIHQTCFAEGSRNNPTMRLYLLRFKRMLDWIAYEVFALYHDGTPPCVQWQRLPRT